jgi:hypothetical protein
MSILLPFSSYGPSAAPIAITLPITVSGAPSSGFVFANGGFVYGNQPVQNSATDPPIVGGGG